MSNNVPASLEIPDASTRRSLEVVPSPDVLIQKASARGGQGLRWLSVQLRWRRYDRRDAERIVRAFGETKGLPESACLKELEKAFSTLPSAPDGEAERPGSGPATLASVSLLDTFRRNFPETAWIVEPMLHVGANNLSADPKSGKSFLCLQVAVAVAQNRPLFSHYRINRPGSVLYLALEDGERRIHERMHGLNMTAKNLEHIDMVYQLPYSLSTPDGRDAVERKLQERKYVLLIVDTLAGACDENASGDVFRKQYQEMRWFQQVAERYGLAALVTMHNRKGEAKAALEKIGGSYGRAAAVNGNLILEKREDRTILQIRSRDAEDADIPLKWGGKSCGWGLMSEVEVQAQDKHWQIYEIVKANGPIGSTRVFELLRSGETRSTVVKRMQAMVDAGELVYDSKAKSYTVGTLATASDAGDGVEDGPLFQPEEP